jgi:hypothetical protein
VDRGIEDRADRQYGRLQYWVVLVVCLLPKSRMKMSTDSTGIDASSTWNDRTCPGSRSPVVRFSLVIAQ